MVTASIRPAQAETDSPQILALINAVEAEPFTLAQVKRWVEHNPTGRIAGRLPAILLSLFTKLLEIAGI